MKWPPLAIVRRHNRAGPDAAGATSENLLPRRPRRGQAAAPLVFFRLKTEAARADSSCDSYGVGLTAIFPAAAEDSAPDEDSGATYIFHPSCTTRPSMPPATVTTWPVTWPEMTGDASATTCAATSSGCVTLRSAMVRAMRATCSSETWPRVIGDSVQPGATAFTRTPGERRTTSFLRLRSRPPRTPDLAAA